MTPDWETTLLRDLKAIRRAPASVWEKKARQIIRKALGVTNKPIKP